jgi:hypothetical protein
MFVLNTNRPCEKALRAELADWHCRPLKPTVGRGAELGDRSVTLDIARRVEPRWNPGTRKVVGAAGFEPTFAEATAGRPATPLRPRQA